MTLPTYATRAELARRAPANVLGAIPTDTQDTELASASRTLDSSFKKGGFVPPLVTWTDEIITQCCYLALWPMLLSKGAAVSENGKVYRQAYEDALAWLRRVEGGLEPSGVVDSSTDAAPQTFGATVVTTARRGW